MLNTAKLIAFAATTKSDAAKKFYKEALGLTLVDDTPFALVFDANGTMLRVQKVQKAVPAAHTALGWHVVDIRETINRLSAAGVRFEKYDGFAQDDLGVWKSPAGALVAWFKDPDGNVISLTQF